eukprot:TRINITY_DN19886_c0_g1_i1.p1 TRINITY_DN19886_c0_g1~~TRINITY_DN19886_c0_g1_i1.p1  ORF type:complete len:190 (-),score=18.34 TRINITY_DN19886_c0_g1_i1:137-646(-)
MCIRDRYMGSPGKRGSPGSPSKIGGLVSPGKLGAPGSPYRKVKKGNVTDRATEVFSIVVKGTGSPRKTERDHPQLVRQGSRLKKLAGSLSTLPTTFEEMTLNLKKSMTRPPSSMPIEKREELNDQIKVAENMYETFKMMLLSNPASRKGSISIPSPLSEQVIIRTEPSS